MSETFLSPRQVEQRTSLSRTTLDRRVAEGLFPKPIRLDGGKRGGRLLYVEREVDEWIAAQIAAWRDGQGPEVPFEVRNAYGKRKVEQDTRDPTEIEARRPAVTGAPGDRT
jgi:predicted DNA-binding transcriptional regulator AlpA